MIWDIFIAKTKNLEESVRSLRIVKAMNFQR